MSLSVLNLAPARSCVWAYDWSEASPADSDVDAFVEKLSDFDAVASAEV